MKKVGVHIRTWHGFGHSRLITFGSLHVLCWECFPGQTWVDWVGSCPSLGVCHMWVEKRPRRGTRTMGGKVEEGRENGGFSSQWGVWGQVCLSLTYPFGEYFSDESLLNFYRHLFSFSFLKNFKKSIIIKNIHLHALYVNYIEIIFPVFFFQFGER